MMKRKICVWIMIMTMTLSLFSGIGSQTVKAEEIETTKESSEASIEDTSGENSAGLSMDQVDVKPNDGIGNLLIDEFDEDIQSYADDNVVYSVELENGNAEISYRAEQDCSLIVAIFSEDDTTMYTSEVVDVASDMTTASVPIDMTNVPEYYLVKAYLVSSEDLSPLSREFVSEIYTQHMQEFLALDVEDFPEEQVVNFDDSNETNFAVLKEEIIYIEYQEGVNVVTKQDFENEEYVIEKATDDFKKLQKGNIAFYEYGEEYIIIGVDDIQVDGDVVSIKGRKLEMEDVFEHLRIDEVTDSNNMDYDDSSCGEGVTCEGLGTNSEQEEELLGAAEGENESSISMKFKFVGNTIAESPDGPDKVSYEGALSLKVTFKIKFYFSLSEAYTEITVKTNGSVSVKVSGKIVIAEPLGSFNTILGPCTVGITPSFGAEFNGEVSWTGSLEQGLRITINNKVNVEKIKPVVKSEFKAEGKFFVGFIITPHVFVLSPKLNNIEFDAKVGVEVTSTFSKTATVGPVEERHLCNKCIEGCFYSVVSGTLKAKLLKKEFSQDIVKTKSKIKEFYHSFDTGTGTDTKCPNKDYRYTVNLKNKESKKPLSGLSINCKLDGKDVLNDTYVTNKSGQTVIYLKKGTYVFEAELNGEVVYTWKEKVSSKALDKTYYVENVEDEEDPEEPGEELPIIGEVVDSGQYETWEWMLDGDGLLLVVGDIDGSDIPDIKEGEGNRLWPWWEDYPDINSIVVTGSARGNLAYMFYGLWHVTNVDFISCDTHMVTDMSHMFKHCSDLKRINLNGIDTSNVNNVSHMFDACVELTELDLSHMDTSSVTDMSSMFESCYELTELDLSHMDTSSVTDMSSMFKSCSGLKNLDIGEFDTSNVNNMSYMFNGCRDIKYLDLSNFDTKLVTDMSRMFEYCYYLEKINLESFDTSNVRNMEAMFKGNCNLVTVDLTGFNTSKVESMWGMFCDCPKLCSIDLSNFDTSSVTDMSAMFKWCSSIKNLNLDNFNTSKVTNMKWMFYDCNMLENLDLTNFDTNSVTDMNGMFQDCSTLTNLDLSSFDTSLVTNMANMFNGCRGLVNLDLSSFETYSVTSMEYMFNYCSSLRSLELQNFDVSGLKRTNYSLYSMFSYCDNLIYLDLSSFDMSGFNMNEYPLAWWISGSNKEEFLLKSPYNISGLVELRSESRPRRCWVDESGSVVNSMHQNLPYSVTYRKIFVDDEKSKIENTSTEIVNIEFLEKNQIEEESSVIDIPENDILPQATGQSETKKVLREENYCNIYVTTNSLQENTLTGENLLYIVQTTVDKKDEVCEKLYISYPDSNLYVATMNKIPIDATTIEIDEMIFRGKTLYTNVSVLYNSNILTQGEDYDIFGDLRITEAGQYSITVYGLGDFGDTTTVSFTVKNGVTNTYEVCFDSNGATSGSMDMLEAKLNTSVNLPQNDFKKIGYSFSGWSIQKDGNVQYADGATVRNLAKKAGETVTLYAKWTANKYSLKFVGGSGATGTMNAISGTYKDGTILPANAFKKTGYTFNGWKGSDGNTYKNKADIAPLAVATTAKTITLTAQWKKTTYTITYELNGGTNVEANPVTYNITTADIIFAKPTKKGYTFGGWFTDKELTKSITKIAKGSTGNKTLYAKWTKTKYTITYNLNGGTNSADNPASYNITTPTITLAKPTRKGYKFSGWYSDEKFTTKVTEIAKGSTGNKTLYAKWAKATYTITYELNGGTNAEANPATYNISTATIILANPTKKGYTFGGWYSDSAFTKQVTQIAKGSTGNKTLYAKWTKNTYTIKFDGNGATSGSMANVACKYATTVELPTNAFKRTGYTFKGWATTATGEVKYANKESVRNLTATNKKVVTLYAIWAKTKYKITYNLDGGTNNAENPASFYYTTATITLKNPTKTGYSFGGWYSDATFKTRVKTIEKGTLKSVTLYAKWTENSYSIAFDANVPEGETATGSMAAITSCKYTQNVILPENAFDRVDYTFVNWNTAADGSGTAYAAGESVSGLSGKKNGTVTLYAQWSAIVNEEPEDLENPDGLEEQALVGSFEEIENPEDYVEPFTLESDNLKIDIIPMDGFTGEIDLVDSSICTMTSETDEKVETITYDLECIEEEEFAEMMTQLEFSEEMPEENLEKIPAFYYKKSIDLETGNVILTMYYSCNDDNYIIVTINTRAGEQAFNLEDYKQFLSDKVIKLQESDTEQ